MQHRVKPVTYLTMKSNILTRSFLTVATRAQSNLSRARGSVARVG